MHNVVYCINFQIFLKLVAVIVINLIGVPYLIIILLPLIVVSVKLRNYYMSCAREIKRLDAVGM